MARVPPGLAALLEAQWVNAAKSTSLDEVSRFSAVLPRSSIMPGGTCHLLGRFFDMRSTTRELVMNWDQIEGNWKQFKGKARQQWGKLTDDDFDQVKGEREQLVGRVQERYGVAREEAERQVKQWETGL
jgi:uncharacterized protein YjbJ (UPF0337 family)